LNAASTLADLQLVTPIVTADGSSALWTASTSTSWLSLDPLTGSTDPATPLTLRIDPAVAATSDLAHFGSYTVTTNQPGTVSQDFDVRFSNRLPWLQRTSAVLTGSSGRIYVDGMFASSRVIETGSVKATGATLVAANYRRDQRFAGDFIMLAIDVADATPGTPVTISANTPLFTSQVNLAVKAPARVTPSYQPLPLATYRPASFAPGLGAFYFSGPGKVFRWSLSGVGAALTQADVAGVLGVALRPDEQRLHATSGATVLALNPSDLALLATSPPLGDIFGQRSDPAWQFDGSGTAFLPSLVYASDGRALASVSTASAPEFATRSPYWITTPTPTRVLGDLTDAPLLGDPGVNPLVTSGSLAGSSLVASPSLHAVVASNPDGNVAMYLSNQAGWTAGPNVGIGNAVVASSDDGQTLVTSNGSVYSAGSSVGNLNALLPSSDFAGGFGVTQDGRHALVYSYQINAAQGPASNALLRVVDLDQALLTSFSPASIASNIALTAPVGCTTLPLGSGESCQHSASITLAPGSSSVFILGPRAVAAVALPASIAVQDAAATKRKRLDTKLHHLLPRAPLKRPLGAVPARH
jgi:hypothetical protein